MTQNEVSAVADGFLVGIYKDSYAKKRDDGWWDEAGIAAEIAAGRVAPANCLAVGACFGLDVYHASVVAAHVAERGLAEVFDLGLTVRLTRAGAERAAALAPARSKTGGR